MASFSNLSKTYAKDKLSKSATTVLLVCCYLYGKKSNTINVNAEDKDTRTPQGAFLRRETAAAPTIQHTHRDSRRLDSGGPSFRL